MEKITGRKMNRKGIQAMKRIETILTTIVIIIIAAIVVVSLLPKFQKKSAVESRQVATSNSEEVATSKETGVSKRDNSEKGNHETEEAKQTETTEPAEVASKEENKEAASIPLEVQARGYCNSFAGYTAAIIANGGLTTQEGSYYAKSGINVSIGIEDNDDVIIEAFKNGEIDFFFMTVNKMSLICKELKEAGVDVVIPYLSDTSTGGDGIVAKEEYDSIEALKNTKIAMARNSVSSTVPVWLMNVSDLAEEDIQTIVNNFALYDSTQEAVDSFVRGECGAVSTWDMNTALQAEGSQLLFSTKEGEYLIIDALVVNKKFAEENQEVVKAMVDGCIQVNDDLKAGNKEEEAYEIIRASVPDFSNYDNETMKEALASSQYLGYQENIEAFDTAMGIYKDFCKIWEQLGFETDPDYVNGLFDTSVLEALTEKWEGKEIQKEKESVIATEEGMEDKEALLSKSCTILFEADSWEFKKGSEEQNYAMLDEYVKIAKVLNKMMIKIEGNIYLKPGEEATEFGRMIALNRAEEAKNYMVSHGVEAERIVPVANVEQNNATDKSEEEKMYDRNCILSIYTGGK